MPPLDIDNVRAVILALAVAIIATVLFDAATAHAQGCMCVADGPTETATADTASELETVIGLLKQDVKENTITATSVTTGGGGGLWRAEGGYLTSLTQNLSLGIFDPQKFAANFPGWLALTPTSTQDAKQISALSLATYAGAVTIAQQQAANFGNEDNQLGAIESASSDSGAVLQAIQANTEAVLAVASQIQALRQIEITHLDIDAVHHGEELNERARAEATTAKSLNVGVAP